MNWKLCLSAAVRSGAGTAARQPGTPLHNTFLCCCCPVLYCNRAALQQGGSDWVVTTNGSAPRPARARSDPEGSARMAALKLRLQKEIFDVTEEQLVGLAHVTRPEKKRREWVLCLARCSTVHSTVQHRPLQDL